MLDVMLVELWQFLNICLINKSYKVKGPTHVLIINNFSDLRLLLLRDACNFYHEYVNP